MDVYAQSLGDDGKVKAPNKKHHVATFPVNSGGSIIMSRIATGCSGEGRDGLPLTLPTTYHEKTYFTHQSKQISCIRMALIVDFDELEKIMYQPFLEEKYKPDSLVFTAEIQDELTHQFQQPNTRGVRTILQERWLVKYNELIEFDKHITIAAFMCGGELGAWVKTQREQYSLLQKNDESNMTTERIKLLEAIGFTWSPRNLARAKNSIDCCIHDCKEPKWGTSNTKYCKKHRNRNTRCSRCNVKALAKRKSR